MYLDFCPFFFAFFFLRLVGGQVLFYEEFKISVLYKGLLTLCGGGQGHLASRVYLGDLNSINVADRWNNEQLLKGNPLPSTADVWLKLCFPKEM